MSPMTWVLPSPWSLLTTSCGTLHPAAQDLPEGSMATTPMVATAVSFSLPSYSKAPSVKKTKGFWSAFEVRTLGMPLVNLWSNNSKASLSDPEMLTGTLLVVPCTRKSAMANLPLRPAIWRSANCIRPNNGGSCAGTKLPFLPISAKAFFSSSTLLCLFLTFMIPLWHSSRSNSTPRDTCNCSRVLQLVICKLKT